MPTKKFTGVLVLNWKTGQMRLLKKKATKVNYSDIPVNLSIDVDIPETPHIEAKGHITIPEHKVGEIVIDNLILPDDDENGN